jgi:arogenate/prephenate dehydratase
MLDTCTTSQRSADALFVPKSKPKPRSERRACSCSDPLVNPRPDASDDTVYKTSIVFSLKAGPGSLFKALSVFALRDLDLTKIENRPLRSNPIVVGGGSGGKPESRYMNHLFYVDVLGSLADENCQNALKHLQESAPFLRVLGSYPADASFTAT